MESSDDEGDLVPRTVADYYIVNDENEAVAFSELPLQWEENKQLDRNGKRIFLRGKADNGLREIFIQITAWRFDISDVKPEISVLSKDGVWINIQKPRASFKSMIRTILITIHCLHYVKKNPEIYGRSLWKHMSKVFSTDEVRPSEGDLTIHSSLITEAVKRDESLVKAKFLVSFLDEKPQKKNGRDPVCSICDDGGEVLFCEGRCMRSFHATVEAGAVSTCKSLGFSDEQVKEIQNFVCKNCQYKQHQCFVCGKLGSSDESSGSEVFSCVSATCGRFYHPGCVVGLLHHDSAIDAEELQKKISDGESFTCPIHKCFLCKLGEDKNDPGLQFAVCRRCPKSYHQKCLPREIGFKDDKKEGITQRAWMFWLNQGGHDILDHILIYCLEHEIADNKTPLRNHIKFPDDGPTQNKPATEQHLSNEKIPVKQSSLPPEGASRKRPHEKSQKAIGISPKIKETGLSTGSGGRFSVPVSSKKPKVADSSIDKNFLRDAEKLNSSVQLDADVKRRILAVMEDAKSSITMDHMLVNPSVQSSHFALSRNGGDETATVEKVEGYVEAIHAALQNLEKGCNIEDAKTVCDPGLLLQIGRWKNKLEVYLASFLYGMRCTSFGPHFTEKDKLKEIVDMLHFYVQDDDMIVDFGCGSNDFSCLMKKKLDEVGKKYSYKNYDIIQAKNVFNSGKRNLMAVQPKELTRSQLIFVLNPMLELDCMLVNKFINKALEFKPKLVILIVPQGIERLDISNRNMYNLVWEDDVLLDFKSLNFPGSSDETQLLCLWSHSDWTTKYKAIARQHGHLSMLQEPGSPLQEGSRKEQPISAKEDHDGHDLSLILGDNHYDRNEESNQLLGKGALREKGARSSGSLKDALSLNNDDGIVHRVDSSHMKDDSNKRAKKWNRGKEKPKQGKGYESPRREMGHNYTSGRCHGGRSASSISGGNMFVAHCPSRTFEAPSHSKVAMEVDLHFDQNLGVSRSKFETRHNGSTCVDDIGGNYKMNNANYSGPDPNKWQRDTCPGPQSSVERSVDIERESSDTLRGGCILTEREPVNQIDTLGFAPGPNCSLSQHNSSGWIDE